MCQIYHLLNQKKSLGFLRKLDLYLNTQLEVITFITLPFHTKNLPTGTQRAIIRQAQLTLDEISKLLKSN